MKTLRMVLASALLLIVTTGGTCDHVPVPPLPTTNPGGCAVLTESPKHSDIDNSCESGEPDSEPNGSLFTAVPLGTEACGSVADWHGRLAATDDVDVFSFPNCTLPFLNPDDLLSHATQEPQVALLEGDNETEICLFASCQYGPTGLAGCSAQLPDGVTSDPSVFPAHLAEGMLGCCRRGPGSVTTNIGCDSLSPAANGYMVVRSIATVPDGGTTICHKSYHAQFTIRPSK